MQTNYTAQSKAQDHVPLGFENLQGWLLHNFSGQPVPGFDHPQSKKCFLVFGCNFLVFNLCPFPPVLSMGTTEKSLHPPSSFPHFRY